MTAACLLFRNFTLARRRKLFPCFLCKFTTGWRLAGEAFTTCKLFKANAGRSRSCNWRGATFIGTTCQLVRRSIEPSGDYRSHWHRMGILGPVRFGAASINCGFKKSISANRRHKSRFLELQNSRGAAKCDKRRRFDESSHLGA